MSNTLFLALDIIAFVVGLILVVVSFLTYTRKGESEISQDVLMTPKFILGIILVIGSAVIGLIF